MINSESEITIPLNEENEEEIDENFPFNQIFDIDNFNNNKDEEEYYDEEKVF